jgi:hypothetical protein
MAFDDAYKPVAERIEEFRAKYGDGRLRPYNPDRPFRIVTLGDKTFLVYYALCYRTPDDPLPGFGCAWEPFPGPTAYTRDSELQNAETSAWGRAMVAALVADTRRGIATADDVAARQTPDGETTVGSPPEAERHRTPTKAGASGGTSGGQRLAEARARLVARSRGLPDNVQDTYRVRLGESDLPTHVGRMSLAHIEAANAIIDELEGN